MVDFYLQILKPSDVGQGSNPKHIVFDESISVPDGDGKNTPLEQRMKNISREPWVTKYGYSSNPSFMLEKDGNIQEYSQRKKWVYTRQRMENRWGIHGGKTYIWEIEEVLKKTHYLPGKVSVFRESCKNTPEEEPITSPNLSNRAPWMEIAINQIMTHGGKHESIIDAQIKKYHKEGAKLNANSKTAWCSSFVCWCLENSYPKYNSPKSAASRSFLSHSEMEKCDAFFGAIAVFSDCNNKGTILSTGHVAFIYGKLLNKNTYLMLGGNQGDMITLSPNYIFNGEIFPMNKRKTSFKIFRGFYKPKNYIIKPSDKLHEIDEYETLKNANNQLQLITQNTSKGESSR